MSCVLKCCTCGRLAQIDQGPPRLAFELAGWANDIGWVGVIDDRYHRALVFCSPYCKQAQVTKGGRFAKRLLQVDLSEQEKPR